MLLSEFGPIGDLATKKMLNKAHAKYPLASSDIEALARYIKDQEESDIEILQHRQDVDDRLFNKIEQTERELDRKINQVQSDVEQLAAKKSVTEQGLDDVNEEQLDEASYRDVIRERLDRFYKDVGLPPIQGNHLGILDIKSPGTRVWTRGDGVRHRDPGYIVPSYWSDEPKKGAVVVQKFWQWLQKQPGVRPLGQISGEFSTSKFSDMVGYKGLYFAGGQRGVEFGSASRFKNPRSVWRHNAPNRGVAEDTNVVPLANPKDTVSLDIPLLIRLLEYAREDAQTDVDLHNVAERLINLSRSGKTLNMSNYGTVVPGKSE